MFGMFRLREETSKYVFDCKFFRKLSEYLTMDYQNSFFFITIELSEYRILDQQVRKTIRLSDIGYQTQTIGLSDMDIKKNYQFPSSAQNIIK
jgi:hypothetical protein